MKNTIFTGSRKNKLASGGMISVILISVLFLAGCFDFNFINQPSQADPNSSFEVEISTLVEPYSYYDGHPYFGILLPTGWLVEGSIEYFDEYESFAGVLYYSESLTMDMTIIDPPPEGYYWWVAADPNIIDNQPYHTVFNIYTDGQTGIFFLDYMLGSDVEDTGLNYRRSNEHHIIIGPCSGCAPEGIMLSNQSDIDNFTNNFPDCSAIAGDLINSGIDITNLDGLNGITSIGGSLRMINNVSLTNLTGLSNLTSIGGTLSITGNSSLTYIQDLNSLTSVGRYLLIEANPELINVSGLNSITTIGFDLLIRNNSPVSFTGLGSLLSIGRNLIIDSNNELNSMTGMNNLTTTGLIL